MSMQPPNAPPPGGSITDVVTQLQGIVRQLTAWVAAFTGRMISGTFTLAAAPSTTVNQTGVKANSIINLMALNAAAGTLMGSSKSLYISSISPGVSFTVATADSTNAVGTESFQYSFTTPS